MKLLAREALVKTGDVDHAAWNYDGLLGFVARRRFHMALALMPPEPVETLLEIGYGSGVFMPELAAHTHRLVGADVHRHAGDVESALCAAGVSANLVTAPAELLPFPNESFAVVVVISTGAGADERRGRASCGPEAARSSSRPARPRSWIWRCAS